MHLTFGCFLLKPHSIDQYGKAYLQIYSQCEYKIKLASDNCKSTIHTITAKYMCIY